MQGDPLDRPLFFEREAQARRRNLDQARHTQQQHTVHPLAVYLRDPVGFITTFIPTFDMAPYQADMLNALVDPTGGGRSSGKGPRGLGKTGVSAVALVWMAVVHEAAHADWKAVVTSSSWYQMGFFWAEVHKWVRELRWDLLGVPPWHPDKQLLKMGISLEYGKATSAAPDRAELIEGAHAAAVTGEDGTTRLGVVMVIFDESKAIPQATFDAIEGVFANCDGVNTLGYALAVSTPGNPAGAFYNIHKRAPGTHVWQVRSVSLEEAVTAGRINQDWADNLRDLWGEDSPFYRQQVLGQFSADQEDAVIPTAWLEAAVDRWRAREADGWVPPPAFELGVDVARHGRDKTILTPKRGPDYIARQIALPRQDTAATTSDIARLMREHAPGGRIVVDADGMGVGVADELSRQGFNVFPFFGAPRVPDWRDKTGMLEAHNRRAAAWWHLRELLDPRFNPTLCLPPDDELLGDLSAPKLLADPSGRIKLEPKDRTAARIGRSPDRGDSLVYAMWQEVLVVAQEWVPSADWTGGDDTMDWSQRPAVVGGGQGGAFRGPQPT